MTETKNTRWDPLLQLSVGCAFLIALLVPNFKRACCSGGLTACKSNLKNIGTAMEMYSKDWDRAYPQHGISQLTPNYLKTIPRCPHAGGGHHGSANADSYILTSGRSAPYNTQSYGDYYFVYCKGENHAEVSVPKDYPKYNGIVGLIER